MIGMQCVTAELMSADTSSGAGAGFSRMQAQQLDNDFIGSLAYLTDVKQARRFQTILSCQRCGLEFIGFLGSPDIIHIARVCNGMIVAVPVPASIYR
jgi:hypothetical protein